MAPVILDCPSCSRKLRVPDDLLGRAVKCPTCDHTFQAPGAPGPATPIASATVSEEAFSPGTADPEALANVQWPPAQYDEAADRSDERPWEASGPFPGRRDAEPHRGTLILVLGIVSIVMFMFCGIAGLPLGIAAWVMGRQDLRKMRQDVMDPEGEGNTRAGWICRRSMKCRPDVLRSEPFMPSNAMPSASIE